MNIIISPYAKKLREKDTPHPKNYPYWKELVALIKQQGLGYTGDSKSGYSGGSGHNIIQIGVEGEERLVENCQFGLPTPQLIEVCKEADTFISVENFFPHFMHFNFKGKKKGIVLFAKSDPKIFGYPENINLLKDKKYLRWDQFGPWEATDFVQEAFVKPDMVMKELKALQTIKEISTEVKKAFEERNALYEGNLPKINLES